jgi:hypothetical protein
MNFGTTRISGWLVYGTALAALLLTLVPLPNLLAVIRPPLLVMTVLYWSTLAPRTGGIFIGFAFGLGVVVVVVFVFVFVFVVVLLLAFAFVIVSSSFCV